MDSSAVRIMKIIGFAPYFHHKFDENKNQCVYSSKCSAGQAAEAISKDT